MRKLIRKSQQVTLTSETEFDKLKIELQVTRSKELKKIRKSVKDNKSIRKKFRKSKAKWLAVRAKELETRLPKSEQWFRSLYEKEDIKRLFKSKVHQDQYNKPFKWNYIPDLINLGYRYVVEIDGSIHDQPDIQIKDIKKNYYFHKRNYVMIRIKAYDEESYKAGIEKIKARIKEYDDKELIRRELTVRNRSK